LKLDQFSIDPWLDIVKKISNKPLEKNNKTNKKNKHTSFFSLDEVIVNVAELTVFNQNFKGFNANLEQQKESDKWLVTVFSDRLKGKGEYRKGTPDRFDITIDELNLNTLDFKGDKAQEREGTASKNKKIKSKNLRHDYPEIFVNCKTCIFKERDFSPLSLHVYPTKKRMKIEYIIVGEEDDLTSVSGIWDQKRTSIVIDSVASSEQNVVKRLNVTSPLLFNTAYFSGAFNWVGSPWEFNAQTLNGTVSAKFENGSILDIDDHGTRFLSLFSLDSISKTLSFEFGNVFEKGFNFDEISLTGNINRGVFSSDNFQLNGGRWAYCR